MYRFWLRLAPRPVRNPRARDEFGQNTSTTLGRLEAEVRAPASFRWRAPRCSIALVSGSPVEPVQLPQAFHPRILGGVLVGVRHHDDRRVSVTSGNTHELKEDCPQLTSRTQG